MIGISSKFRKYKKRQRLGGSPLAPRPLLALHALQCGCMWRRQRGDQEEEKLERRTNISRNTGIHEYHGIRKEYRDTGIPLRL